MVKSNKWNMWISGHNRASWHFAEDIKQIDSGVPQSQARKKRAFGHYQLLCDVALILCFADHGSLPISGSSFPRKRIC